jgi:hypothetical protein
LFNVYYHSPFLPRKLIHANAEQPCPGGVTLLHHSRNSLKPNGAPSTKAKGNARLKAAVVNVLMVLFGTSPGSAIALGQAIVRIWPGFRRV